MKPADETRIPFINTDSDVAQLIVDNEPYLIIGGELHNSSASSSEYMQPVWKRLKSLHLNTVLAVASWELIEPIEGQFDFSSVDQLIEDAKRYDMRLVLLWFGTWKNGMSSYVPGWVKRDSDRFPRVRIADGEPIEVISTFAAEAQHADTMAFAAMMRHVKEIDGTHHTVIMIQVQNEVGVLGDSRDRSDLANRAFADPVPQLLIDQLSEHKSELHPMLKSRWEENGYRDHGTWEEIFGPSAETNELFMAWNYARYIDEVAAAGKGEYPLPMFANAWLSSLESAGANGASGGIKPGEWPSGGPLPHTLDIWLAGAPSIDFLSPDIYQPNFQTWCAEYTRRDNLLFIPEMSRSEAGAWQVFSAIGEFNAIGVSPFAIDSVDPASNPPIKQSYQVLTQIAPLILEHRKSTSITGFILSPDTPNVVRTLGGYQLEISLDEGFGQNATNGAGLIMTTGPNEFVGAGFGFRVRFSLPPSHTQRIGIEFVDEGEFKDGQWVRGRRLNGDETGRGNYWRFYDFAIGCEPFAENALATGISRCTVYRYH